MGRDYGLPVPAGSGIVPYAIEPEGAYAAGRLGGRSGRVYGELRGYEGSEASRAGADDGRTGTQALECREAKCLHESRRQEGVVGHGEDLAHIGLLTPAACVYPPRRQYGRVGHRAGYRLDVRARAQEAQEWPVSAHEQHRWAAVGYERVKYRERVGKSFFVREAPDEGENEAISGHGRGGIRL